MKKLPYIFLLVTVILLTACNSDKKKASEKPKTIQDVSVAQIIPFPGQSATSLPHLTANKENPLLSWVKTINDSTTQFNYAYLMDGKWQQPKEIITGKNWFVNWADYPTITENNGNLLAHFLKKSSGAKYAYDVKLNVLPSQTSTWQTKKDLHTDGTNTEHGFVTTLPYKEDSFFMTWLDGRNTGTTGHGGAMTIRAAEVDANGTVSNEVLLDGKTCSCCQTTAAMTKNGPIVLYRDRTDDEIRDIAITRHVNGTWTEPKFIYNDHWKIDGCPVNGPKVVAIDNDIAVAWFTAVNDTPQVKVVFSNNGGADFSEPILISNTDTLGRVDIVLVNKDNAIVSWMETINNITYLKAIKVDKFGKKHKEIFVSKMGESRKTGFPQMERVGNDIYFAWTFINNEVSSIKTAFIPLDKF